MSRTFTLKRGFTLIELLVVISIIALLLAILIPSLARAKEDARRVLCASFLHQFALVANTYSVDYDDCLPSFQSPSGPHTHDVVKRFISFMQKNYDLKYEALFCPSIPRRKRVKFIADFKTTTKEHHLIGYNYWVPRFVEDYNVEIPPEKSTSALTVIDTKTFRAPKKTSDPSGKDNPIMTDQVAMRMSNPLNVNIGKDKGVASEISCHKWNDVIDMTNQVFVDGHVEKIDGKKLKIRYGYGSSPTGAWIWR